MNPEIELSIVIPTLNEELTILKTVEGLSAQKDLLFEVIISDGGSVDSTCVESMKSRLAVSTITGRTGRATQLNRGAMRAKGEFILFLHADSSFSDNYALRKGIDALRARSAGSARKLFAGHFCLKFNRSINTPSLAYNFIESKARLDREGCSHGDQGILISAGHFSQTDGFDESCHILAETRFADRLRRKGEWMLLPAEIVTSARRFEQEGMKERQTLNAIIMALAAAGRDDILATLPDLYRNNDQGSRLDVGGLFTRITSLTAAFPENEQSEFWQNIGIYTSKNAWQLALFLDELKRFYGMSAGRHYGNRFLALYERHLEKIFGSRFSAGLAKTLCIAGSNAFTLLLNRHNR
jgi:rSAM/selenodomain-associated transferase 2